MYLIKKLIIGYPISNCDLNNEFSIIPNVSLLNYINIICTDD